MKNWTIGKRIIFGFTVMILITAVLGVLALTNMRRTETEAKQLAELKVPQVRVANEVERAAHLTLYQMRGYGDTEQTNFLQAGLQNLEATKKRIAEARELSAKSPLLANLKTSAENEEDKVQLYDLYVQQTVAATEGIQQSRKELVVAAQSFMQNCTGYLDEMNSKMAAQINTNAPIDILLNRHLKITLINEVMQAGEAVRIAVWRSQAERDPRRLIDAQTNFAVIKAKLDELRPITTQAADLTQIDGCQAAADAYKKGMTDLQSNWQARDEVGKVRLATGMELLSEAQNTAEDGLTDTTSAAGRAANLLSSATFIVVVGLAVAMMIGVTMGIFITRGTNRVLNGVAASLSDGSNQVASAAGQVSASSQTLAEGSSEQASSLEETSSSLEEMASMTKRNADNARKANELAKQAREAADKGVGDMQTMSSAMAAIKVASDDIAKIIKTIDGIAFQTNILALNAAVEAARAGEAGMGFAVVAEEVRNLAQRCAQAAKETAGKIEGAIAKTEEGVQISSRVAQTLNEIVAKVRQVDELVSEVAGASREQTDGITQINTAVGQMDKVTQSNAATAEESSAAAQELNAQSEVMKQSVAELLQLVGGNSQSKAIATATSHARRPAATQRTKVAGHRPVPVIHNGHGNGHAPLQTKSAQAGKLRNEIPLDGDFKDF
ncbi:MAG: methyl-accepting chemotaxis protein [Verrucomicrobiota bacterium]|jgi:methyl-accepting chemotaxis protein